MSGNVTNFSEVQVKCNKCGWYGEATELEKYADGILMFCPIEGKDNSEFPILLTQRQYAYPENYELGNSKHWDKAKFIYWRIYQGVGGKIITAEFV